jgi:hypothetical protein
MLTVRICTRHLIMDATELGVPEFGTIRPLQVG